MSLEISALRKRVAIRETTRPAHCLEIFPCAAKSITWLGNTWTWHCPFIVASRGTNGPRAFFLAETCAAWEHSFRKHDETSSTKRVISFAALWSEMKNTLSRWAEKEEREREREREREIRRERPEATRIRHGRSESSAVLERAMFHLNANRVCGARFMTLERHRRMINVSLRRWNSL